MLRITNEEKNHIKLMYGLIKEQSKPIPSTPNNPTTPPKTTTPPKSNNNLINKTINLYTDIENKNYKGMYQITNITPKGEFLEIKLGSPSNQLLVTWNCLNSDKLSVQNSNEVFYNTEFLNTLKSKYCSKSSGGATVPKADFASNTTDNTNNNLA